MTKAKKWVAGAIVLAGAAVACVWRLCHEHGEPAGRAIWLSMSGYLAGCACGLVAWMDVHTGATAGLLGLLGVGVQAWAVRQKTRDSDDDDDVSGGSGRRGIRHLVKQRGAAAMRVLPVVAAGALIAAGATHQVTQRQYDFTSRFEGVRLTTYEDPAVPGLLTVCRGITNAAAPGWVIAKKTYTPQECFDKEIELMQTVFAPAIGKMVRVTTTQEQREMLGDFAWNEGIPKLRTSTLMAKLNTGNCWGAAEEFDHWIKAGGRRWASIGSRRNAEQDNFRKWCKP